LKIHELKLHGFEFDSLFMNVHEFRAFSDAFNRGLFHTKFIIFLTNLNSRKIRIISYIYNTSRLKDLLA